MTSAAAVNAHTHLYSGLASLGMPAPVQPPGNFIELLQRVWWRMDAALDERTLRAAARFYAAEALSHGTAVLVDHHESPHFIEGSLDVIADACQQAGIAAVLCYGATERNGGRDEARRGLAECRRFIRSNRRPLVRGVIGLHASFTVSDETIREAGELCRELNTILHVHLAEDRMDVTDAIQRGYRGPLERLEALGALRSGSILAHCVHLDASQVHRAWELGCWIVQNPRSNRHNNVGYPVALGSSTRVALGTDGFVSDLQEESRVLLDEAFAHGEDSSVVVRRTFAGERLAAQFFDEIPSPAEAVRDTGLLRIMPDIRADAEDAARALWSRMAAS